MTRSLGYATVQILNALAGGATFGFEIMRRTDLPSWTVYPTLRRLERALLVTSFWEEEATARAEARPRRRYFQLTRPGEAALEENLQRFRAIARGASRFPPRTAEG